MSKLKWYFKFYTILIWYLINIVRTFDFLFENHSLLLFQVRPKNYKLYFLLLKFSNRLLAPIFGVEKSVGQEIKLARPYMGIRYSNRGDNGVAKLTCYSSRLQKRCLQYLILFIALKANYLFQKRRENNVWFHCKLGKNINTILGFKTIRVPVCYQNIFLPLIKSHKYKWPLPFCIWYLLFYKCTCANHFGWSDHDAALIKIHRKKSKMSKFGDSFVK